MKLIVALTIALLSLNASAHNHSKQEKIVELANIMDMDSMMNSIYTQMELAMKQTSQQMKVAPSEQVILDRYYSNMTNVIKKEMSWAQMEPMIIKVYDKHFSEHEIDDMLAFYRTKTGQSIITKMPQVMQESMMMSQQLMQQALPKIQAATESFKQELAKVRAAKKASE